MNTRVYGVPLQVKPQDCPLPDHRATTIKDEL